MTQVRQDVVQKLVMALKDCADDLEAEIEARYSHGIKEHPAMTPKYERDMEPVLRARELLDKCRIPPIDRA